MCRVSFAVIPALNLRKPFLLPGAMRRKGSCHERAESRKEKLLTLQSEQRRELSGFDQMERELQTAVSNVDTILHPDTIPTRQKTKIQAER